MVAEKVIYFVSPSSEYWGAERSLFSIATGLRDAGTKVALVASSPSLINRWRRDVGDEVVGVPFCARSGNRLVRALGFFPALASLPAGSTSVLFDIDLMIPAAILRRRWKRRHLVSVLDLHTVSTSTKGRRVIRRLAKMVDGCIAVSDFAARQVDESTRTAVVHRPMDSPGTCAAAPSNHKPTIGIIGRIDPQKMVEFGLHALGSVREDIDVRLRGAPMDGGAHYLVDMVNLGRDLMSTRFKYEGSFPNATVFSGLDYLLFLNPVEPSGRVVAEAQMRGVVVIGPDSGGAAEFIDDEVTGYKFRNGDVNDCAAVIEKAVRSPQRFQEIAEEARTRALGAYNYENQCRAYAKHLSDVRTAVCR